MRETLQMPIEPIQYEDPVALPCVVCQTPTAHRMKIPFEEDYFYGRDPICPKHIKDDRTLYGERVCEVVCDEGYCEYGDPIECGGETHDGFIFADDDGQIRVVTKEEMEKSERGELIQMREITSDFEDDTSPHHLSTPPDPEQ